MKKKKLILLSMFAVVATVALYGFREYYRRNRDLAGIPPDLVIRDTTLLRWFTAGGAGNSYIGHIVQVDGMIRKIEKDEQAHIIVILGASTTPSAVRCSIDSVHIGEIGGWQTGHRVKIKGMLVGFNPDETGLLGSDVELNRCVPEQYTSTTSNQ
ncbi:MAG TPA: hypothetical protein VKQ52_06045 [Puia sp.]|nr:hypothetical protein [Puia sp.]